MFETVTTIISFVGFSTTLLYIMYLSDKKNNTYLPGEFVYIPHQKCIGRVINKSTEYFYQVEIILEYELHERKKYFLFVNEYTDTQIKKHTLTDSEFIEWLEHGFL